MLPRPTSLDRLSGTYPSGSQPGRQKVVALGIGLVGSQLPHPATMPETPFTYATHPVDPRLQPWIRGAWTFTAGADAPPEHHLPPDGTASLVLVENRGAPGLIALGPRVMPMVVPTVPGVTFKGLRLAAEAAPLLVGAGAAERVRGPVPAPRLGPVSALVVVGALCHDTPLEIAHAIDTLMLPRRDELPPPGRRRAIGAAGDSRNLRPGPPRRARHPSRCVTAAPAATRQARHCTHSQAARSHRAVLRRSPRHARSRASHQQDRHRRRIR